LYISTNGTTRDAVFDKYYKIWIKILNGEIDNDSVMPFIYKLDHTDEIKKSKLWVKAIPLLGITTEKETIESDIEMSKNDPVMQAELMAKTFNLPINNYLAYFTNEECKGNHTEFRPELFTGSDERKARCIMGVDLSDINDICAISFMIVDGEKRYFITKKYVPRSKVNALPKEQRDKYLEWEAKKLLHIHEKEYNDREYIFKDLLDFINCGKILPVKIGYDRWGAREFIKLFEDHYGADIGYDVAQTVKGLSQGLKLYKTKSKSGNIIFNDELTGWATGNVNVKTDANNNVFPNRQQAKAKIDPFAAQLDAFITYEDNKEDLQYYFD
jgi:phage terminase large subunit-like protein